MSDANKKIIISTGDIKPDYEILGLVYSCVDGPQNADEFNKAFLTAVDELKKGAGKIEADAIIHLKPDYLKKAEGYGFYLHLYGTAVKVKEPGIGN